MESLSPQNFDGVTDSFPSISKHSARWQRWTQQRRYLSLPQVFWVYSTFIMSAFCLFLLWSSWSDDSKVNKYEHGFDTDLDVARSAIRMHRVRFTGGLHWDENGTLVRNHLPDGKGPEWVGPPSPEMDSRWDHVTSIAAVDLTGKDANMVKSKTRQRPTGEYITGLDVFHQLHCLDKIRRSLHPNYYHDPDGPEIQALHTDHCLDYIRQSIMCTSDMTPAHVVYSPSADRWSPDFESEHVCRDFQSLVDWTINRQHVESISEHQSDQKSQRSRKLSK